MGVVKLVINDQDHEVTIKEYRGHRVVTLRDVDELHARSDGTARDRFNNNKKRFIDNEDYFVCNSYEAKTLFGVKAPNGLVLLTESGYLMLVKSFNDDLAWNVQRQMVNAYFKAKEMSLVQQQFPQTIEDILISALTSMKEMKQENAELKRTVNHLEVVVDNEIILTRQQRAEIQQAVNRRQGELNNEGYNSAHFQGIYSSLKTHFNVPSYAEIKRTDFQSALNLIAGWYPKKK